MFHVKPGTSEQRTLGRNAHATGKSIGTSADKRQVGPGRVDGPPFDHPEAQHGKIVGRPPLIGVHALGRVAHDEMAAHAKQRGAALGYHGWAPETPSHHHVEGPSQVGSMSRSFGTLDEQGQPIAEAQISNRLLEEHTASNRRLQQDAAEIRPFHCHHQPGNAPARTQIEKGAGLLGDRRAQSTRMDDVVRDRAGPEKTEGPGALEDGLQILPGRPVDHPRETQDSSGEILTHRLGS